LAYIVFLTSLLTRAVRKRNNNLLSKIPICSECILRMFRIQFCVTFKVMPLAYVYNTMYSHSEVFCASIASRKITRETHSVVTLHNQASCSGMARCPAIARPRVIFRPYPVASYGATSPT
jgi:hypothetical protein